MKKISIIVVVIIFFLWLNNISIANGPVNLDNQTNCCKEICPSFCYLNTEINSLKEKLSAIEKSKGIFTFQPDQIPTNKVENLEESLANLKIMQIDIGNLKKERGDFNGTMGWVMTALGIAISILILLIASGSSYLVYYLNDKIKKQNIVLNKVGFFLTKDHFRRTAWYLNNFSIQKFEDKDYQAAINFTKKSIELTDKVRQIHRTENIENKDFNSIEPIFHDLMLTDELIKRHDALYKSNLAFYFAKLKDKNMGDQAIKWSKFGLREGRKRGWISLIDSYLYVICQYSDMGLVRDYDLKSAEKIYNIYKDQINSDQSIPEKQRLRYAQKWGEGQ